MPPIFIIFLLALYKYKPLVCATSMTRMHLPPNNSQPTNVDVRLTPTVLSCCSTTTFKVVVVVVCHTLLVSFSIIYNNTKLSNLISLTIIKSGLSQRPLKDNLKDLLRIFFFHAQDIIIQTWKRGLFKRTTFPLVLSFVYDHLLPSSLLLHTHS